MSGFSVLGLLHRSATLHGKPKFSLYSEGEDGSREMPLLCAEGRNDLRDRATPQAPSSPKGKSHLNQSSLEAGSIPESGVSGHQWVWPPNKQILGFLRITAR